MTQLIQLSKEDMNSTFTSFENTLSQVEQFHNAFAIANFDSPRIEPAIAELRIKLLDEELTELKEAIAANDLVETLDALVDLQYVLDGAFLQFGMAHLKQEAFNEVHRSNMSKLDEKGAPIFREDGKVMKGPNYFKPNLAQFITVDTSEPVGCTDCSKCGCCSRNEDLPS